MMVKTYVINLCGRRSKRYSFTPFELYIERSDDPCCWLTVMEISLGRWHGALLNIEWLDGTLEIDVLYLRRLCLWLKDILLRRADDA